MPVTCWDGWRWHRASGAAHTGRGQRSDPVSSTAALGHDLLPLPAAPARYPQRQVWGLGQVSGRNLSPGGWRGAGGAPSLWGGPKARLHGAVGRNQVGFELPANLTHPTTL